LVVGASQLFSEIGQKTAGEVEVLPQGMGSSDRAVQDAFTNLLIVCPPHHQTARGDDE